jgi:hypothetical protein
MTFPRRDFIKQVGIALASMMMVRCTGSPGGTQPDPDPTSAPTPSPAPTPECVPFEVAGDSPRERLRSCWTSLDWLASQAQIGGQCGEGAQAQLKTAHIAALNELSGSGELTAPVREHIRAAFDEAVYHVWYSNAPISCYESMGPIYRLASREQIIERAKQLDEMASSSDIAPETIAQAQAALEHDIAFLNLSQAEEMTYTRLAMGGSDYPAYSELDLEIDPEATEAATFLLELLSGQQSE